MASKQKGGVGKKASHHKGGASQSDDHSAQSAYEEALASVMAGAKKIDLNRKKPGTNPPPTFNLSAMAEDPVAQNSQPNRSQASGGLKAGKKGMDHGHGKPASAHINQQQHVGKKDEPKQKKAELSKAATEQKHREDEHEEDDVPELETANVAEEHIASLYVPANEEEKKAVEKLLELQEKKDDLEEEYEREILELKKKYDALQRPWDQQRKEVVNSGSIPGFWLRAFKNCSVIEGNITEKDAEALEYLTDIRTVNDLDHESAKKEGLGLDEAIPIGGDSFALIFEFRENPFFDNKQLSKVYIMDEEGEGDEGLTMAYAKGTKINWKSGKNLTVKVVKKTAKGRGKNVPGRTITKMEPCDSFFNFFSPPEIPEDAAEDDEIMEEISMLLEADLQVGDMIRSEIVPNAIYWFTGDAQEDLEEDDEDDEDYDEYDEDEDDLDENDEDEDEDEDEDDDEDDDGHARHAKARKGSQHATTSNGKLLPQDPQECKQQ
eukprot:CAMPEP_0184706786 /NCGR_PEP_ID=MMETSP0313-20130426/36936_1 /TAXON_ID=2792 /ORGANISM="Porphyridium aerugineum, Strain SAG 1380-2" /LENGTH=491 /DNA_ID=CAMNT_0027168351 /DNA_START=49 /DNA_END=1524 /DNA_ORIENTATION=+